MQKIIDKQRKQLVRLKRALQKKEKKTCEKKALSTLEELLPNRIVNFVEMQLKLHKKKREREKIQPRDESICFISLPHQWQGIQVNLQVFLPAFEK